MNREDIFKILDELKNDKVSVEDAYQEIKDLPFKDLGFAKIDNHREIRVGYPEVIYCENKTIPQIREIIKFMLTKNNNILATRATKEMFDKVKDLDNKLKYNELGRTITLEVNEIKKTDSYIAIVSAGTSDLAVVEEAKETASILGNKVKVITDVGVAGIHRLYARLDIIREAKVVIVIAGMEGALASVVGGLVDKPIIAVPTSVGYGANFNGLSALLSMLNSCASGVSVVNIDNGFGAAYNASMINQL
ncbi:1-(5-phosphoribosyl)-5-amino-4-imidazole-carboxyl ate carboxylase [Vallitalea longa]|uniref:1-(5-phosphoribosyl)-5-amino-4-imidazole-carboxyl ate carboxylase n=1 Tax=Vallitalea longa TaxID=2936439 RepID=A0A9W6DE40_9FIRM|nr:nickel pincer cofactor biosynthesis protein LarB [Vallitalea longa]GKX29716.1 1-(5-phosphoribosyl)-5-amino-4-imidazole-carboxyl ate carboxylase [Vallitalea longa]